MRNGELHGPAGEIDTLDARGEPQVDAPLAVPVVAAQRDPFLGRVAREVVLREIRPIGRRRAVGAEHRQRAVVALAAQHVGGGQSRGATADDHDRLRRGRLARARRHDELLAHVGFAALLLDAPARQRIERRCAHRLAARQVEARVVPWTAHRAVGHQALGQRPVVVRARCADRVELAAAADENRVLAVDLARDDAAVAQSVEGDAGTQIGGHASLAHLLRRPIMRRAPHARVPASRSPGVARRIGARAGPRAGPDHGSSSPVASCSRSAVFRTLP
jgi:hypothetical protein